MCRGGDTVGPCPRPVLGTGPTELEGVCPPELVLRSSALVFHGGEGLGLPRMLKKRQAGAQGSALSKFPCDLLLAPSQNCIRVGQTMAWVLAPGPP